MHPLNATDTSDEGQDGCYELYKDSIIIDLFWYNLILVCCALIVL